MTGRALCGFGVAGLAAFALWWLPGLGAGGGPGPARCAFLILLTGFVCLGWFLALWAAQVWTLPGNRLAGLCAFLFVPLPVYVLLDLMTGGGMAMAAGAVLVQAIVLVVALVAGLGIGRIPCAAGRRMVTVAAQSLVLLPLLPGLPGWQGAVRLMNF